MHANKNAKLSLSSKALKSEDSSMKFEDSSIKLKNIFFPNQRI